jgi:ribose transport system permease protein
VSDAVLVVVTLAACMCFGAVSSLLVAYLNVNSLVVTLGMSTLALGLAEKISGENTLIPRLGSSLDRLGGGSLFGIPMTFVILVVAAAAALYWLEYTPSGRYVLAAGDNPVAARLAGVPVRRIQVGVLVASSLVAGCTGILLAGKIGEASTVTANGYLLPAIAGLFLGATQVKPRVNVLGTLIAIYLIGVGVKGLQLAGSQAWVSDVFNGAVLLLAIALTARRSRAAG